MGFLAAVTNAKWLTILRRFGHEGEVNFWRPGNQPINARHYGKPLVFVQKGTEPRKVVGMGIIDRFELRSIDEAWQSWGTNNGVDSLDSFRSTIEAAARSTSSNGGGGRLRDVHAEAGTLIGCVVLKNVVLLPEHEVLSTSEFFSPRFGIRPFPKNAVTPVSFDPDLPAVFREALFRHSVIDSNPAYLDAPPRGELHVTKVVNSWSLPEDQPNLIGRKQVDRSMFIEGSHIPVDFHTDFARANGGALPGPGASQSVVLVCEGNTYDAKLDHRIRPEGGTRLLIVFPTTGAFAQLLRSRLPDSYRRFVNEPQVGKERSPEAVPEHLREYVEFYATETPFRYEVKIVSSFDAVWAETGRVLATTPVVHTLTQGAPNQVKWLGPDGLEVYTGQGQDRLPKAMFEAAWQSLIQSGSVIADNFPGTARFRSSLISAVLAQLPYVEYTTYPRITLFLTSHIFTNAQLAETFKVGMMGGIRVAGDAPDWKLVVFITGEEGDSKQGRPYHGRWEGDTFFYTGEGLKGDQGLKSGNRALQTNVEKDFPLYGFERQAAGGYRYMGRFKVQTVHEEQQKDTSGTDRSVLVFNMKRITANQTMSESEAWVFQATPDNYRLREALQSLKEIAFTVNQHRSRIHTGHQVYFWKGGPQAGVVGVGTVITEPAEMPDRAESLPFWTSPELALNDKVRAIVRVDRVIDPPIPKAALLAHPILKKMTVLTLRAGTNFRVTPEQATALGELLDTPQRQRRVIRLTVPGGRRGWTSWRGTGQLDVAQETATVYDPLFDLELGDRVLVTRGPSTVLGVVELSESHLWPNLWLTNGTRRVSRHQEWLLSPTGEADPDLVESILATPALQSEPNPDLTAIVDHFATALGQSGITFGSGERHFNVVRSFVASLATKRLAILTGLSGSGKTQIAIRFGQWFGKGRHILVPVRPDWTSPEALFGYKDALRSAAGKAVWEVPEALSFMLQAARDPNYPYLLILDEMNLAHVERYFADFLSGMESGEPCLPNLHRNGDGDWTLLDEKEPLIPVPDNLFVVGTVNVDETTYMFSPKVLDRANTLEFRVHTDELTVNLQRPLPVQPGPDELVRGFLDIAADDDWQRDSPAPYQKTFADAMTQVHMILLGADFEFGHRVFYEALRYASMLSAAGATDFETALDQQIMQKVLPKLHGSRRRLEPTLRALGQFCYDLTVPSEGQKPFQVDSPDRKQPKLPVSFDKIKRMIRSLIANQFTSFTG